MPNVVLIGQEQFGHVHLAYNGCQNKWVAVKHLQNDLVLKEDQSVAAAAMQETFICQVLAQANMPNTVRNLALMDCNMVASCGHLGLFLIYVQMFLLSCLWHNK